MNLIQTAAVFKKSRILVKALLDLILNSFLDSTNVIRQLLSDEDEDGILISLVVEVEENAFGSIDNNDNEHFGASPVGLQ